MLPHMSSNTDNFVPRNQNIVDHAPILETVYDAIDSLMDTRCIVKRHPSLTRLRRAFWDVRQVAADSLIRDLKRVEENLQRFLVVSYADENALIASANILNIIQTVSSRLATTVQSPLINKALIKCIRDELFELTDLCSAGPALFSLPVSPKVPRTPEVEELCFIELNFRKSGIPRAHGFTWSIGKPRKRSYAASTLLEWVAETSQPFPFFTKFGTLRSVHLYRERKLVAHHEFILLSFEKVGACSWIRAERSHDGAASDSSQMALGAGVTLVETVTFSNSMGDLTHDYVEVSSIYITPLPDRNKFFWLSRTVLQQLSTISPQYSLFSENCRWFAQRVFFGISHILEISQAKPTDPLILHHPPPNSIYSHVLGVRHLELWNMSLRNTILRGWAFYHQKLYREVRSSASQALNDIENISPHTTEVYYLHAIALHQLGLASKELYCFAEAKKSLEKALKVVGKIESRMSRPYIDVQDSLAGLLFQMGSVKKAIVLRNTLMNGLRKGFSRDLSHSSPLTGRERASMDRLAVVLHNHGADLEGVPGMGEIRLKTYEEEIWLHQRLDRNRPLQFQYKLGAAMMEYAIALKDHGRLRNAFEASKEALTIARDVNRFNPFENRSFLATTIYNHATYASTLRNHTVACCMGFEAVELFRRLYRKDLSFRDHCFEALVNLGTYLQQAGRLQEARAALQEAFIIVRAVFRLAPEKYLDRAGNTIKSIKELDRLLPS